MTLYFTIKNLERVIELQEFIADNNLKNTYFEDNPLELSQGQYRIALNMTNEDKIHVDKLRELWKHLDDSLEEVYRTPESKLQKIITFFKSLYY